MKSVLIEFKEKEGLKLTGIDRRERIIINRYKCGYCGACVGVCPKGALELIEIWLEVDKTCTGCGVCVKICPLGALEKTELAKPQEPNSKASKLMKKLKINQPLIEKP